MKLLTVLAIATFANFASAQSLPEAWEGFSDPDIMDSGFTHVMNDLPLEGQIAEGTKAWSGHYWPSKKGSINNRWNSPKNEKFDYKSPKRPEVMVMSQEQLATLSPSEKYDLFTGNYDYPVKTEAKGAGSKSADDWMGICHGWAPAALHHNEPTPKVMTNPDGLKIPFGSADIKALLSYYYAFHYEPEEGTGQIGQRCFFGRWLGGLQGCENDLNAGAFHIIIANKLGLDKEGFLMDRDMYKEVWNQPVVGYKSKVMAHLPASKKAAKSAIREMRIATELFYVDETEPQWKVNHGTEHQKISKMDLVYRIELNYQGKIVGGEWESKDRPDFLWNRSKAPGFGGKFARLAELLND